MGNNSPRSTTGLSFLGTGTADGGCGKRTARVCVGGGGCARGGEGARTGTCCGCGWGVDPA